MDGDALLAIVNTLSVRKRTGLALPDLISTSGLDESCVIPLLATLVEADIVEVIGREDRPPLVRLTVLELEARDHRSRRGRRERGQADPVYLHEWEIIDERAKDPGDFLEEVEEAELAYREAVRADLLAGYPERALEREPPTPSVVLASSIPWGEHDPVSQPCPECGDRHLPDGHCCLRCHNWGRDFTIIEGGAYERARRRRETERADRRGGSAA
jgi:hypothetical protein